MAIERSLCPPDFSRCIMAARTFAGSKFSWVSSSKERGSAERIRGIKRARIAAPQAYRPVELKAKPTTGTRSRTASVMTATTDVVISEKSKLEFLISDFSGTAHSRMSTIRMWLIPIPVTVRCARAMALFDALHMREPMDATHVSTSAVRRARWGVATNAIHRRNDHDCQRSFRGTPEDAGVCRKERRRGATGLRRLHFGSTPSHERV